MRNVILVLVETKEEAEVTEAMEAFRLKLSAIQVLLKIKSSEGKEDLTMLIPKPQSFKKDRGRY